MTRQRIISHRAIAQSNQSASQYKTGPSHVWLMARSDHTHEEKENTIEELVREITALWQTDELRRKKPSALDGKYCRPVPDCQVVSS